MIRRIPKNLPSWYKIPEVRIDKFIPVLKNIYDIIEDKEETKNKKTSGEDPFLKSIIPNLYYKDMERKRKIEKKLSMKLGYLHENVSSFLPGCQISPAGSGCDIINKNTGECFELKNRNNTLNSNSANTVDIKLRNLKKKGFSPFLVQINCPTNYKNVRKSRHGMSQLVKVLNGKEYYQKISKRGSDDPSFFDDLLCTISYIFDNFPNYSSLIISLKYLEPSREPRKHRNDFVKLNDNFSKNIRP